jgi:Fusaric acid resistance protein-like
MASHSNPLPPATIPTPPPAFLADLYTFKWSELNFKLPLISASAVALCLFTGVLVGHPSGGLIAGGGALTIGFGANQRIADSRLLPMMFALLAMSTSTLAGTLAGHNGYELLLFAAISAFIYGVLTARDAGLSWVGQQASIALLVASAFPTGPRLAFIRAGLIILGGVVQILITSAALRLMPELGKNLLSIPRHGQALLYHLRDIHHTLPALSTEESIGYTIRIVLTMLASTWAYLHIGIQSGYWIPMTALLVQRPTFTETLTRTTARVAGTLVGAWLCSLLIAHLAPSLLVLAAITTLFAFCTFATTSVNYALFTAFITGYIVFLLSLNQIPGTLIAHRRAWCTIVGGLIALVIHIDALRRYRFPTVT